MKANLDASLGFKSAEGHREAQKSAKDRCTRPRPTLLLVKELRHRQCSRPHLGQRTSARPTHCKDLQNQIKKWYSANKISHPFMSRHACDCEPSSGSTSGRTRKPWKQWSGLRGRGPSLRQQARHVLEQQDNSSLKETRRPTAWMICCTTTRNSMHCATKAPGSMRRNGLAASCRRCRKHPS